VTLLPMFHLPG